MCSNLATPQILDGSGVKSQIGMDTKTSLILPRWFKSCSCKNLLGIKKYFKRINWDYWKQQLCSIFNGIPLTVIFSTFLIKSFVETGEPEQNEQNVNITNIILQIGSTGERAKWAKRKKLDWRWNSENCLNLMISHWNKLSWNRIFFVPARAQYSH